MRIHALILCLALGACDAPPTPAPTPAPGLTCPQTIAYVDPVEPGLEVVLDAVALPTGTALEAHPTSEPGWLFAKRGLLVRAGHEVRLRIHPDTAQHARLDFPEYFPAGCSTLPGWLVFAGGYVVDAPQCVRVLVSAAEQTTERRIGVGVTC